MRTVSAVLRTIMLAGVLGCGGSGPSSTTAPGPGAPPPETPAPSVPTGIVIYAGNGQTGGKGTGLGAPLCTNVVDAAGHLLHGITVTYTVATGGGTITAPTSPTTDNSGIATSGTWILGPGTGTQTVTASSAGVPSVTFTATSI
jgi:hypothetical protein